MLSSLSIATQGLLYRPQDSSHIAAQGLWLVENLAEDLPLQRGGYGEDEKDRLTDEEQVFLYDRWIKKKRKKQEEEIVLLAAIDKLLN